MDAQSKRITLTTALVAIFSAFAVSAQAADIKVLSDGPIKPALTKVADLFRQETHTQVHMGSTTYSTSGPRAGDFDPWVQKRIEGGEVPRYPAGSSLDDVAHVPRRVLSWHIVVFNRNDSALGKSSFGRCLR